MGSNSLLHLSQLLRILKSTSILEKNLKILLLRGRIVVLRVAINNQLPLNSKEWNTIQLKRKNQRKLWDKNIWNKQQKEEKMPGAQELSVRKVDFLDSLLIQWRLSLKYIWKIRIKQLLLIEEVWQKETKEKLGERDKMNPKFKNLAGLMRIKKNKKILSILEVL